jgi:hypothetical protein
MDTPLINFAQLDLCRVSFDMEELVRALHQHGTPIQLEASVQCPCKRIQSRHGVVVNSAEPRTDCLECNGSGIITGQPIPSLGLVHSTKDWAMISQVFGQYSEGDVLITLPPEHIPDRFDRITMMAGVRVMNEQRRRTDATVERLRYPIVRRKFDVGMADGSPGVRRVERGVMTARYTDAAGVLQPNLLRENVDFVVTDEGDIDWSLGLTADTAPVVGAWYSIRYYARPVFVVQGFPYLRRDSQVQAYGAACPEFVYAPVLVHASPEFLGHRNVRDANDPMPNPDVSPRHG